MVAATDGRDRGRGRGVMRDVDRRVRVSYPAGMRLASLCLAALLLGCAHSPEPPPGPRPLGNDATLMHGEASLAVRFSYEVGADRGLTLLIDLTASGTGSVGTVELAVASQGFVVDGAATWSGEVPAGTRTTQRVLLRPGADGVGTIEVRHGITGAPANDPVVFRFLIDSEQIRPCQPADEACKV